MLNRFCNYDKHELCFLISMEGTFVQQWIENQQFKYFENHILFLFFSFSNKKYI